MKTIEDIYTSIKNSFYDRTKLEIAEGSVIDNYTNSVSVGLMEAYKEIEKNKNPHIFTKLEGSDIDSMGILVGCARRANEDDRTYLYRMINWNTANQTANATAIEAALTTLDYSSHVDYVPYTHGVGTATAYIIPKDLEKSDLAIKEVQDRLKKVTSQGSYVECVIPNMKPVKLVVYMSIDRDEDNIKRNLQDKIREYINNIAPGNKLEIGHINKIGINETNVNYFSVSQMYIDNEEYQEIFAIQKLEDKFLFDEIVWNMVVM